MTEVTQLVVKSKFSSYKNILSKKIDLSLAKGEKILNVMSNTERILNMDYRVGSNFILIIIKLGIYFIYLTDNIGSQSPHLYFREETINLEVNKDEFLPKPGSSDFSNGDFKISIRNIKAVYDIDIGCTEINIDISAFVVVNLVKERFITIDEKRTVNNALNVKDTGIPLENAAISRDYSRGSINNYISTLDEISKAITGKISELEKENELLKNEIKKLEMEILNKTNECIKLKERMDNISQDYTQMAAKKSYMEEKYLKEQSRANLLKIENAKNIDEIKLLKKERDELQINVEKNKTKLKDKIIEFMIKTNKQD